MLKIKMKSLAIWFSAITMTVMMSACGGGSGDPILGQNVNSTPATPIVTVTPIVPAVTSVTPTNGTTNVATNLQKVIAQFSVPMDTATLTTDSFTLVRQANLLAIAEPVDGVVSYINNAAVFTLDPNTVLNANTIYTATINTLAESADGVAIASNKVWSFTTGATPDTTRPFDLSIDPLDNATGVALNKNITAIFSEALDPATVNANTFTLADTNGTTPVAVEGNVSYSGNTILFNPDANLTANTEYTATVTTDVTDIAGNPLAADKVWNFTTGNAPDTTRPTVSSTNPENNATGVALTKDINATFSEAINPLTANITSFKVVIKDVNVPIEGKVSYSGETISFNPDINLEPATNYTASITTDVEDLAGNAMASDYNWTFKTATIPVTVAAISPKNGDVNVSIKLDTITAEFNVDMNSSTLTTNNFFLKNDTTNTNVVVGGVTYANRVAELNITEVLVADTNYTATITTDVKSMNGVALLENYNWTFTTGDVNDTTPPEVNSTSPRDGSIDVLITKIVTATFSESMTPSSITAPGTFTLIETDSNDSVDGNVSYSIINKIASFNPTLDLVDDTNYTAIITTAAKDLAGNEMLVDYNWTFVTVAAANPPLVALGAAQTFGIAATAGVTNTLTAPNTVIDGDVVLNPTASCNQVSVDNEGGFGLCGGAAPDILTWEVITPTYPDTTTAQNVTDDLRAAYLSITPANMPGGTPIAAGTTLGAQTGNALVEGDNLFKAGVYTSDTSILVTGDLTLDAENNENATFVFQSASTIGSMPNARILLINGAKASNVYWQAGSDATLQTNSTWNGNIFAYRDITMLNGATSCGRLFAGAFTDGAFVFDSNKVVVPGNSSVFTDCQ